MEWVAVAFLVWVVGYAIIGAIVWLKDLINR